MLKMDKNARPALVLNTTIADLRGAVPKGGMLYGLELELEGRNVAMEGVPSKNWRRVEDGSLRGESTEYVFTAPCEYDEALKRVDRLFKTFAENKVVLKNSYRTSTHVHLNFSDKIGKQVVNFFFLHTILEEVLEHYCGDMRKGNLFCLSCRDNEELVDLLETALFTNGNWMPFNNEVRYNAANLAALNKFCTIELRTMRGADSADDVKDWLEVLKHLYEFACKDCPPPWRLVESLSNLGPEGFITTVFPAKVAYKLLKTWPANKSLQASLMNGVRLIQMLAYKLEEAWNQEVPKAEVKQAKVPFPNNRAVEGHRVHHDDMVIHPDHGPWHVGRGHIDGQPMMDDDLYVYDAADGCYKDRETGTALRWKIHNDIELVFGSEQEQDINWLWYEQNEPQEEDWEPDFNDDNE